MKIPQAFRPEENLEKHLEKLNDHNFLLDKIRKSTGYELRKNCREYLNLYAEKEYSKEVAERLFSEGFHHLIQNNLENEESIDIVIGTIWTLNEDLEKYKHIETNIDKMVTEKQIKTHIEKYTLLKKERGEYSENFIIGAKVKVIKHDPGDWKEKYFSERSANFPEGSVGTIIKKQVSEHSSGKLMVEFDKKAKKYSWTRNWFKEEWRKRKNKGIANFEPTELLAYGPTSEVKMNELEINFKKLIDSYTQLAKANK